MKLPTEATLAPRPWRLEHYTPSCKMTGECNGWATRILDARGRVICTGLDPRWNRGPHDPGAAPTAELIVRLANAEGQTDA